MRLAVQVTAADRAKPGAVLAAEDLVGQRQGNGVARPRREVERVVLHVGSRELVRFARAGGLVFPGLHIDSHGGVAQTAHARPDEAHAELQLEQKTGARAGQGECSLGLLRNRDVALPAEPERLELDFLDVAKLLARLQPDRAQVEGRHNVQSSEGERWSRVRFGVGPRRWRAMGGVEARTQGAPVLNEIRVRPVILNADALRRPACARRLRSSPRDELLEDGLLVRDAGHHGLLRALVEPLATASHRAEELVQVDLESGEDRIGPVLHFEPRLARLAPRVFHDFLCLALGKLDDLGLRSLPDGLLPRLPEDSIALALRLGEHLLALLDDPASLLDLLRNRRPHLVEDVVDLLAVDANLIRQRDRFRVVNEVVELVDEYEYVHDLREFTLAATRVHHPSVEGTSPGSGVRPGPERDHQRCLRRTRPP